ncbi:MAG: class I SAM-dependent DNA methyltransferase [Microcoleus sp. PH2017_10_PVI_O_A]|uniref:class I SAM-dependent DNA methyltransferase n=1 Tax=unclassified Microcoleus TaxID=2642155 RepID=UPI001D466A13|nr:MULTISPECIES: DNA methyltransferase [unclassified Microcoleus]TAE79374.1 MAG: class I SAM-dependent DNA methyltransferase [Oscillatoriales cyanobacterium]MCC3408371.1 class I SAM-dependent DNA methyltransferase [Microcoleus sp. PH2017_10_PVI_O_A]MCC3462430.1 class I SAM-dependent DNA methyltransferase [Microcoleus sp. PH2017_11_PCY_U_A]MCC3480328.1 class I SAM-dependent DNA methyltransferase [Microcoleus sp. PH2017_12_PCY_D_A]MCC3527073.1 class I SAM-dependent DNA methyltransferase [Microco
MNEADRTRVETFITRWAGSSGNERANYQLFFVEMCDALAVDRPMDKGRIPNDPYCFDKDVKIFHPSGKVTPGFVDFHKAEHFLIEAKQGGTTSKKGTAKRGTNTYLREMEKAFVQAVAYTRTLSNKPPFLLTCDIGDHFELWMGFSGDYGGYGARREIALTELQKADVFDLFVDIFSNPQQRNPEKIAARVTREVAADLAQLAKGMEAKVDSQQVAQFLMRCIFTMFVEDVGLLKEHLFTQALETRWIANPKMFKPEVEALWVAMNQGTSFGFHGKLLRFNGGLFADSGAFDLTKAQLEVLLQAAKRDWCNVEPAIFGTLLERALDARERSKLGAHYTPRSYVERLVKPVVMEPLGDRWIAVQAEVKQLLNAGESEPTANQRKKAIALLEAFLTQLQQVKILDPACGSGNFLYVTLDLLKGLESEVLRRLEDVTGAAQLRLDINQVNPSQFLGIEINPRAAAIADLVIWIGYLQWHFRRFGDLPPIEPVLREYKNIECRDAVLAYDGIEPDVDASGKVRTRWGGRMIKSPVTGEDIPDPTHQVTIYRYLNPRAAVWPEADYIVSNPPFIGNARMRDRLGDGYAEALRKVYKDVPDTVDFVMYWWHKAAELTRSKNIEKFGFISTNTIRQVRQRKVIDFHLSQKNPIRLIFAIPDHPWADGGAAVTVAMTGVELNDYKKTAKLPMFGCLINDGEGDNPEDKAERDKLTFKAIDLIFSNLKTGIDVTKAHSLKSNANLTSKGFELGGMGFLVSPENIKILETEIIHPFLKGEDLAKSPKERYVIDVNHLSEQELEIKYPKNYQWLIENVKPVREINNDLRLRREWWRYRRSNAIMRDGIQGLDGYILTPRTAKHRCFTFRSKNVWPESEIIVIFLDDMYYLGVLSSKIHVIWALAAGGDLGGNTPRYNNTVCFDPFPFPDSTDTQKQTIRELGERLDRHRKRVQTTHPEVTITGMYNLLEKLRKGEPLNDKDKAFNQKALVSTLKQIHDELDRAVFAAYGWETTLTDDQILENLVTLNAQRAAEERNGHIRWLRPDYQNPGETYVQPTLEGITTETETPSVPTEQQPFPKTLKEQLSAIRDLLGTQSGEWTATQVTAHFKGANRKQKVILDCLESLEDLGILLSHNEGGMTFWHLAEV